MEMALGALPRPSRVPGRASDPSRSRDGDDGGYRLALSWNFDRVLRVSVSEASYRRKGRPRGCPRRPHHPLVWARPGRVARWCGWAPTPLCLIFWLRESSGEIGFLAFVPSNSENIHFLTFLEPKTAENRQLALWLLLIG